ncbi:uncharacterized protein BDV17DRAFT_34177 [Aspergillus undulatus]|uniref:uncharacterized protein n=1 Tax=Aspergillus undulatus TaxID=1810928 RepID=UPI003CCD1E03
MRSTFHLRAITALYVFEVPGHGSCRSRHLLAPIPFRACCLLTHSSLLCATCFLDYGVASSHSALLCVLIPLRAPGWLVCFNQSGRPFSIHALSLAVLDSAILRISSIFNRYLWLIIHRRILSYIFVYFC